MQVNARCHCGQLSLFAQIDPQKVFVCFCTDCQQLSGTAFRTVVPAIQGTVQVQGDVQHYTKTAESGNRRVQGFCPVCGSPMYSKTEGDTPAYVLRVGVLEQAGALKPSVKLWQRSQWPWVERLPEVTGCEHQELF
ncbi:MAG: hypothetical protein RL297_2155 [Pseudomonadota bacterium]|jgi:hypothetical protein